MVYLCGIAYADEKNIGIRVCMREIVPPFSPANAIAELSQVIKSYGLTSVVGDKYSGTFASEQFGMNGILYEFSGRTKSQIYVDLLPLLNSGKLSCWIATGSLISFAILNAVLAVGLAERLSTANKVVKMTLLMLLPEC